MKQAFKKIAALTGIGLSLLAFLVVLIILIKGWELSTPLKEGVSSLSLVAQQALQRLEGGLVRLRTPVGRALSALDQLDAAVREGRGRSETDWTQFNQGLATLHERFAREIEAGFEIASVVGEAASVFNRSLGTISQFSRGGVPPLQDELARIADQFQEMRNRLQESHEAVDGLKTEAIRAGEETVLHRIREFRAPLTWVQKTLEGTENFLGAKRRALMDLEANLLFDIDLGILGLTLLCPLLMVGQVSLIWALGLVFRRVGKGEA
jgi:hypothetical protein